MRLADRVAIVTGAGRGIGRAISLAFAREGADLAIADLNATGAEETAAQVRALGRRAIAVPTDVTLRASVEAMVERVVADLGRIDILVSNAGVAGRYNFLEISDEVFDRTMNINVRGVFLCGQIVARQMVRAGTRGAIVNMASQRSEIVDRNQTAYATSKGAVRLMTKGMAVDLAPHGIRVNAIGPATVETDLNRERLADPVERQRMLDRIPLKRLGRPEDIANAALFLASDEAGFVTGHTLFVDGGWLAG